MGIREMSNTRKTCSTIFLLPGIGLQRKDILKYGFLSAYIDDKNHSVHYAKAIYMLFRPENLEEFQEFLFSQYSKSPCLVQEDYDYEGGYVVIVYMFPEKFYLEYDMFCVGKYSSFRKEYTDLFPKYVEVVDKEGSRKKEISLQFHIFTKSEAMKEYQEKRIDTTLEPDSEVWSSPDLETKETLDIYNL